MSTQVLRADIPMPLAEKVAERAAQMELSTDSVVEEALTNWLALQDARHVMTLEALADVKAGRFVEHEAVQAWVESLGSDNPLPFPRP